MFEFEFKWLEIKKWKSRRGEVKKFEFEFIGLEMNNQGVRREMLFHGPSGAGHYC